MSRLQRVDLLDYMASRMVCGDWFLDGDNFYEINPMIHLRFVRGMGWDSKVIEWGSRAWCSHAEWISNDGKTTFGAQLKGGVRFRNVSDPCYKNVVRWSIWDIPSTTEQDDKICRFMADTEGSPYDWRAIISFALGERDWHYPGAWFCSQWCMKMLLVSGIVTSTVMGVMGVPIETEEPISRITPIALELIVQGIPGAVERTGP